MHQAIVASTLYWQRSALTRWGLVCAHLTMTLLTQLVMRAIHQAAELLVYTQQHTGSHLMLTSLLGPTPHQIISRTFVQHLQSRLSLTAWQGPCCPADLSSFTVIMLYPIQQQTMSTHTYQSTERELELSCCKAVYNVDRTLQVKGKHRQLCCHASQYASMAHLCGLDQGTVWPAMLLCFPTMQLQNVSVVLQINYGTRTLERVYQLHSAAINCMLVSEGLCVTGSDDRFMRVWPLDFSDFLLEVSVNVSNIRADHRAGCTTPALALSTALGEQPCSAPP